MSAPSRLADGPEGRRAAAAALVHGGVHHWQEGRGGGVEGEAAAAASKDSCWLRKGSASRTRAYIHKHKGDGGGGSLAASNQWFCIKQTYFGHMKADLFCKKVDC